jgi:CMP-N-acetylneuraminic acid synthetase
LDRPENLSGDAISLTSVMNDISNTIECKDIVILRLTSPIRIKNIIDKTINKYSDLKSNSLMTGFYNKEYEWFTHQDTPSQSIKGWFQGNGCVEITNSDILKKGLTYGNRKLKYITEDIYNHEIDTNLDLIIVEAIMKYLEIKE